MAEKYENKQQDVVKSVEKLDKGKVIFPYTWWWKSVDFILTVQADTSVKIVWSYTERQSNGTVLKKNIDKIVWAKDFNTFSQSLWSVLDEVFGTARQSVPEKAKEAYSLLWFKEQLKQYEKDTIKQELSTLQDDINKSIETLIQSWDYKRDEKTKTLSYYYKIDTGKNRDVEVSFEVQSNGDIKVILDATNTLWYNRDKEDLVKVFKKSTMNSISQYIRTSIDNGFQFATLTDKETLEIDNEPLLGKIEEKAKNALILLRYYTRPYNNN